MSTAVPDLAALLTSIFQAQADAQQAQANVTNANFIAFHTATAQALAAKSGDKDSKLTAMKQRILQACAGQPVLDDFEAEAVYRDMALEGGTTDSIGRILKRRLKPIPLSPHKTHIHVTPQLIATIKSLNFSANGDKTYAGCTKGITIFTTPWRTAEAINEDLAEDEYFEASTLKSVADVKRHVTSAKVELPTSLLGLVRVLNNYCRLLEELFGPECHHLEHVLAIRDALETHEADLESRLTSTLILHLMWRIHQDARQFFLACEGWDEGESLPRSLLDLTVRHLVEDCHIQTTLSCPEMAFLGTQVRAPGGRAASGTRASGPAAAGPQPTVNTAIPPLCQKVVGTFNRLYPGLTITDLCKQGRVKFSMLRVGREGACMNYGLLGRCAGCQYRHEVCTVPESRQASVAKAMEKGMATMKAAGST
jgi:hypothetical protein